MDSLYQNAINSYTTTIYLHQQDSFTDEQTLLEARKLPLHIYLICKCPIIKLDPEKIKIEKNKITLCFYTSIGGIRKDIHISTENREINNITKAECKYPFTSVHFYDKSGNLLTLAKCGLLLKMLANHQKLYFEEFNLEVLYVGQAFGSQGERITIDRLKSHDKAQKIYFDTQNSFPDYEIWFLSMVFEHNLYTTLNLNSELSDEEILSSSKKQNQVSEKIFLLNQFITVVEASLIKYFDTYEYNKEYLNYPSPEHTSYSECYKMDFNSTVISVTTYSIHSKLFSKKVGPNFTHHKTFFLHTDTDRKDMFDWQNLIKRG